MLLSAGISRWRSERPLLVILSVVTNSGGWSCDDRWFLLQVKREICPLTAEPAAVVKVQPATRKDPFTSVRAL